MTVKRSQIGFLSTFHRDFYEDGKYVEVWNDPVNYILSNPENYTDAYDQAEKRVGNYRMGVRRHITHLGGTIDDDELDHLEDELGSPLILFPLFPPKPAASYIKPFRAHLIASDVGYLDYVKAAHPTVTPVEDRYAYQSKQSTGFRHFIFNAGNSNMKANTSNLVDQDKVEVGDLETVVNVGIAAAMGSGALPNQEFIPIDGEWLMVNIKGQHIIRSRGSDVPDDKTLRLQMYTAGFAALQSEILLDSNGDIIITAGTTDVTITKDGSIAIDDGTYSVTVGTSSIAATDGSVTLSISSGVVDVS